MNVPEPQSEGDRRHAGHREPKKASTRGQVVVLGQIDESFHQVGGGVVHETLLRLEHAVDIREGPHPDIYPMLGNGDLHLLATSWLPGGHSAYWRQIESRAIRVTPLYGGARFFWAVPDYVPESQVSSLSDLARSDVIERMAELVVQGTTPGAGLTMRSQQLLTRYGLDRFGWSYQIGDLDAIIRRINQGIAAREWFVTPLWEPQYLNRVHRMRPLDDPLSVFPPPDQAWLTANRLAFERLPETTRAVLRKISFEIGDTTEMDHAVHTSGMTTLEAARAWMDRNPDRVNAWFH
jgi:glycine betaine/proline transport system substrate-binding protein